MKDVLMKILYPNKILGFFIFNIAFALLIYVFVTGQDTSILAYVTYPLSAYALTIFCAWAYHKIVHINKKVKDHKIYKYYKDNPEQKIKHKLIYSLTLNSIYGVFKLITGIYYQSFWFITFAVYYLCLCFMKSSILLSVKKEEFGKDKYIESKKLRIIGIITLFLDMVLSGIIVLIIKADQIIDYSGILIYIMAMYDFYLIITAIINIFRVNTNHSPLLLANKCINLTVAMIAIVSLEVAMLYQFGTGDIHSETIMIALTGFAVAIVNAVMSVIMITKSNKYLKEHKKSK